MSTEHGVDTNFIVIKGRFKAINSSSYGQFIVFLDNMTKNVEKYDVVSSHFSTLYENNIGMPWSELEELITKLKWKGEYATSLTHDVQASIEDLFQPGTGRTQDIWVNIKKAQLNKVVSIFEEVLSRPTTDKNIKCELSIETVLRSEVEDVRKARKDREGKEVISPSAQQQDAPKQADPALEESAVLLEIALVLSPISGIPIYELKEGEKIMVKITEQSSRGQYFIDLLNASVDNEIVPVPATVVKVTKEGKIYNVLVNIGPGVYGKSIDEDTVKVKKYDPTQDKQKKAAGLPKLPEITVVKDKDNFNPEVAHRKKAPFSMIFMIIAVAAVLMLAVMVFLFV